MSWAIITLSKVVQGRAVRQAEPHFFLCLLIQEKFKHLNDIWTFIVNPKCNKNTFALYVENAT